jgi:hypothetical protein
MYTYVLVPYSIFCEILVGEVKDSTIGEILVEILAAEWGDAFLSA